MSQLIERRGDLFKSGLHVLAHGVNCRGAMGAGIAIKFREMFPVMYSQYRDMCLHGQLNPGSIMPWDQESGWLIYNLATQPYPGPSASLESVGHCIAAMLKDSCHRSVSVIGMPRVGAGLGGLQWGDVKEVIEAELELVPDGPNIIVYSLEGSRG